MATGWGCWDHPGQGGPARDHLTVGGCPDWFLAGSQGCFWKNFLKCMLICPSTRDHLHLQLLAVSSEFFPLKSIGPPGKWTVQWKKRRHFLRVLFSTAQTLPQSGALRSWGTVFCLVTCYPAGNLSLNWINGCSLLLYLGKTSRTSDIRCNYFSLISPSVKYDRRILVLLWVSLYLLVMWPFNILVSPLKGWLRNA